MVRSMRQYESIRRAGADDAARLKEGVPQDAADRAYHAVLAMILSGEVHEGEWLRESSLAEKIGVSRTPVREALKRLAAEAAVELHPNRGARLTALTDDEAASLLDMRVRFEPLAVKLAVPRMGNREIVQLEELDAQMRALIRARDPEWSRMSRLNNEFHGIFIHNAGNRHLAVAIQTVIRPVVVARTFRTYTPRARDRSMRHHAELIDATRSGDGEWAEAVMRAHVLAARHAAERDR